MDHIEPCCGCGYCCMKARCAISYLVFDTKDRDCPALVFKEDRFWCQLAEDDSKMREALYIGDGCSSTLGNTQRRAFLNGAGRAYLKKLKEDKYGRPRNYREVVPETHR